MSTKSYLKVATILSAAGVAFAGYLSYTRMSSGTCAFSEPCPFFLGHPACYTGFALFSIAFALSAGAWALRVESTWPMIAGSLVGLAGVAFAGRLTIVELSERAGYRLGLPTCAYGLVFFAALFVLSAYAWSSRLRTHHPAPR